MPIKRAGPLLVISIDNTPKLRLFKFCKEGPTTVTTTGPPTTTTSIETTSMCGQAAEMESLFKHKPYLPVHFNTDDAFLHLQSSKGNICAVTVLCSPLFLSSYIVRASAFESRSDI